jgi:TonB-dependent receptor
MRRFGLMAVASPLAIVVAMTATAAFAQTSGQTGGQTSGQTSGQASGQTGGQAGGQTTADQSGSSPPNTVNSAATTVKELVVTGLRQSLQSSERIKRNTDGVVDVITAEDIGKFPDQNLAESIQRIPGVTIDRNDGEGNRVTVRGFGPEYNLVTLNGRSMPGSIDFNDGQTSTRSFDFQEISADGISGVSVTKTGRADVPSGGIGSTIDIQTARPFDYDGQRAVLSVKGTDDTSTPTGTRITPEVSGLYSNTFFDNRLGVLVNGSYYDRWNQQQFADVGGWLEDQIPTPQNGKGALPAGVTDNQTIGTHNYEPQSMQWGVNDFDRKRTNFQSVIQFKPMDNMVITADYTYALLQERLISEDYSAWFTYGPNLYQGVLSKDGTLNNFIHTGNDISYDDYDDNGRNELGDGGLNMKWKPFSNLDVNIDAHHGYSDSGGGPNGAGGNNTFAVVGIQQNESCYKTFNGTKSIIPTMNWYYAPGVNPNGATCPTLNPANPQAALSQLVPFGAWNQGLGTSQIAPQFTQANNNVYDNSIDEYRFDTTWRPGFDGWLSFVKDIKFGAQYKDFSTNFRSYNGYFAAGNYLPQYDGFMPSNQYGKINTCKIMQGISGGGCAQAIPYFYTYQVQNVVAATDIPSIGNYNFGVPSTPTSDNNIDEKTYAGFVQTNLDTYIFGKRFKALIGLRYENTDVDAQSLQELPEYITWDTPTEFHTVLTGNPAYDDIKKHYNEFLPNVDTSLEILHGLLARLSYSKTITRSDLNSMVGTESVTLTPKDGARNVTEGNPGLLPYTSQNIDASLEWYYKKDSYISFNYFEKHVDNFLTNITEPGVIDAAGTTTPITDPGSPQAAWYQQAVNELVAANGAGFAPTTQQVFNQEIKDHPPLPGQLGIKGQPGDPAVTWEITSPINAEKVEIHGIELAMQHVFGETGFGLQANISLPEGGASFNTLEIGNQFALPGLSKSYNLVGFYEKYGFQARLAYTWRSHFLDALGQGQGINEPVNTAAYGQLDATASYALNPHTVIFFDGINLTNSYTRYYGRFTDQFLGSYLNPTRLQLGVRFKF